MRFNRPPRIQPSLPYNTVEIPAPANVPSKPSGLNILGIALPLGAVLLTVMLMSSGGGGASSYLRFLPIMLATYLATGVTYVIGNRKYKRDQAEAKEQYRQTLNQVELKLSDLQESSQKALLAIDPSPVECLDRARRSDARLGERRPADLDFLAARIGLGDVAPTYVLNDSDLKKPPPGFDEEHTKAGQLVSLFDHVPQAPIATNLSAVGSLGFVGAREAVADLGRAFLCQIATHHWPSEVQLAAVANQEEAKHWQWISGLPHAARLFGGQAVAQTDTSLVTWMRALETELQQRLQLLEVQTGFGRKAEAPLPRLLVVVTDLPTDFKHPGMTLLLSRGKELGAHAIFMVPRPELVPGECGAVVLIREGRAHYREAGKDGKKIDCKADRLGQDEVEAFATALSSIRWPEAGDVSRPPELIRLLELLGSTDVSQLPIEQWWDGEPPFGYLRAPIGRQTATAELIFDLNDKDGAHGPHGLIGGMTGSGKSEVLKTILLALAATHSPYDLNFALIDFKGGAAFNELAQLPHTVGIITDIEGHASYAERVIQALAGEIEHRKRVLERARAAFGFGRSHIDEYRKLAVKRPLSRLVIVFDEFAEFKHRNPEESKRLISIARQGRSLGVHLILATQNIEAAIDPEILQNSTFRICLRVSQAQDSVQMIGIPDAVSLARGRAYFQAQTRHLFQAAYSGGEYVGVPEGSALREVVRVKSDGQQERIPLPLWQSDGRAGPESGADQYTEAQALVDRLVSAARSLRLRKPPAVWPDPLPERLYLPVILSKHLRGGWDGQAWQPSRPWRSDSTDEANSRVVIGLTDRPAEQRQMIFQLDPERGGQHLLIFGSAATGKSTLLRTLVSSIALTRSPAQAQIYALDFGGQSALKVLEGFPHVGAVVTRFEDERVIRLLSLIQLEVSRRNELLRSQGADNLLDFNSRAAPESQLPSIYLLIDGYGEFKRLTNVEVARAVASFLGGGAAVGLHLVVSATLQAEVPNDLFANVALRLAFHLADQSEYYRIVGKPSEAKIKEDIEHPPPPGRGLLRATPPLDFQAALPVEGNTDEEQLSNLAKLAADMQAAWSGPRPRLVEVLPLLITVPEVSAEVQRGTDGAAPSCFIGTDYENLSPVHLNLLDDGPSNLIAAVSPQSGKTTLLRAFVLGLAERCGLDRLQLVLLDYHSRTMTPFRAIPHRHAYVGSAAGLEPTFAQLTKEIQRRQAAVEKAYEKSPDTFDMEVLLGSWPHILVVIDDYDRFSDRENEARKTLTELLNSGGNLGVGFILAGNISELPRDYDDPFIQAVRKQGNGVLLCGTEGIEQFNNARRPQGQPSAGLPPGRGYLIRRGQVRLLQTAAYWREGEDPDEALANRIGKLKDRHR